ncbi:hypothetical protein O6H91_Y406700 [Diphasiastrum complanatum]|nr:hypothetical protein O6H91_Y406700 [Diphasiastrum complanatum]
MGLSTVQMDKMLLHITVISAWCVAYSMAMSPAPAPQIDCTSQISALIPCLGYVQGTVKVPPPDCCISLSFVVKNTPLCLCQLLNSPQAGSAGVNESIALELPAKCGIHNANVNQCPGLAPSPQAGGTTPGVGGSSTPMANSPNAAFVSTPTNMVYLAFLATCLLFLVN